MSTTGSHHPHTPHLMRPSPADVRQGAHDEPHGRETALAWTVLVVGCVSFVLAAVGGSMLGLVLGVVGAALAIGAQLVSATTAERWLVVPGWVMATLGIGLNMFFMWD